MAFKIISHLVLAGFFVDKLSLWPTNVLSCFPKMNLSLVSTEHFVL